MLKKKDVVMESTETNILKPCPFCGTKPSEPKKKDGDERNGYNFTIVITCKRCGVTLTKSSRETINGRVNDTGQALSSAITTWNTRWSDEM